MHKLISVPAVWLGWILSRLVLARLIIADPMPFGDVHYYHFGLFGPDPTAMTEYPDAGVWPVRLLAWLTTPEITAFLAGFMVMCLLIDAAVLALLLRYGRERRFVAGWFWVFFGVATGGGVLRVAPRPGRQHVGDRGVRPVAQPAHLPG